MLENQLSAAQKEARIAREIAEGGQPKPFKRRLLECLDSIDPQIKEKLKMQTFIYHGDSDFLKAKELLALAAEPGASEYFEFKAKPGTGTYQDKQRGFRSNGSRACG